MSPDDHAKYELPADYVTRNAPEYCHVAHVDAACGWQLPIYEEARRLAIGLDATTLIDLGCGMGEKTVHDTMTTIGFDFGENLAECRARHGTSPGRQWISWDMEREPLPAIPDHAVASAVVVCADVIEHLINPECLLGALARLSRQALGVVVSTPDRELVRGNEHRGPPPNPCHVREWSHAEFVRLLHAHAFRLSYSILLPEHRFAKDPRSICAVASNERTQR